MLEKIKLLVKFCLRFGIWNGTKIFYQSHLGKNLNVTIPGIKQSFFLRHNTSDLPTFHQVFLLSHYEYLNLGNPKIIIDGGANIGLYTIKMKNDFPDAQFICIEPDPENFAVLQKNLSKYDNVHLECGGLWGKDTKLKVYDKYNAGKWGLIVEEDLVAGNINAISIDSLLKKYQIEYVDVLKLDIETSEKQLFTAGYENWLPKVKILIVELHDWMEPGCSKPFFTAINKCINNYSFQYSGENVVIANLDI